MKKKIKKGLKQQIEKQSTYQRSASTQEEHNQKTTKINWGIQSQGNYYSQKYTRWRPINNDRTSGNSEVYGQWEKYTETPVNGKRNDNIRSDHARNGKKNQGNQRTNTKTTRKAKEWNKRDKYIGYVKYNN